jgi:hypothetical protein
MDINMQYDPPTPPEMGLRELRRLRESGALPAAVSKINDFHETMIALLLDANCLRRAMSESRGEWEQRLFARHLALVLYEGFDDMAALLPEATREFAQSRTAEAANAKKRLGELKRSLATLRRRYAADLEPVRHAAAAHRDHDIRRFHEAVDSLDLQRLEIAATDFLTWTATVGVTVTALLLRHSGVQAELAEHLEAHADQIVNVTTGNSGIEGDACGIAPQNPRGEGSRG